MDTLAHGLWVGLGLSAYSSRRPVTRHTAIATITIALIPDVVHVLPVAYWAVMGGDMSKVIAYIMAIPGAEPAMADWARDLSHHLHCAFHSGVIAGIASIAVWRSGPAMRIVMTGWWSHILIDVLTHSNDFYPSPVLYPLTYRGFDGLAWNTPGFAAANYAAILVVALLLHRMQKKGARRDKATSP
jgi:hypothetical protein